MANGWKDLIGTTLSSFLVGVGATGVRLKNVAGNLVLRNKADNADINLTAGQINANANSIVINADATGTGADRTLTISKNAAATANLEIIAPPSKGTDGQFLRQRPGTAAGVIELELAPVAATGAPAPDTTTLSFGTASPLTLFQLPANAEFQLGRVVIDTPWVGGTGASFSVGIAGSTSKYLASGVIDLTDPAGTYYEFSPGLAPAAAAEDLIATYVAGGATAGSARIIVHYAVNT
ncbi:MAG: hypothetical protein ACRC62_37675 [Microcoleus sp.]